MLRLASLFHSGWKYNFSLVLLLAAGCAASSSDREYLTRAEASGFTETSRYMEVMEILEGLDAESNLMRLTFFGESAEGKPLPLVVLGNPPPAGPEDVDPKLTKVFFNANIHAGEVEGKEACLMLIREIVRGPLRHLLDGNVLLLSPIYNPDGNDRIAATNRYWQGGPDQGVGIRSNAQHLDLNRDMVKLESPEAQGLTRNILVEWDPHLTVDCHTTNGSYHREPITYAPPCNPMINEAVLRYHLEEMLPSIDQRTLERDGYHAIPYGNFKNSMKPEEGWYTFDHRPRYLSNYVGMRNRFSILIEMYAYAEYEVRIKACYSYLQSILEFTGEQGLKMKSLIADADTAALRAGEPDSEPLRFYNQFTQTALEEPIVIQGYRMEMGKDHRDRERPMPIMEEPVDYTVPYFGLFETEGEGSPLPEAYIFPMGLKEVRKNLALHGIRMEEVTESITATVEAFAIEKIEFKENLYQGHRNETLIGKWEEREVTFHGGAVLVPTKQPQAILAAYLLEPESDDGLLCWNLLDRYITRGAWDPRPGTYPIMKWKGSAIPPPAEN